MSSPPLALRQSQIARTLYPAKQLALYVFSLQTVRNPADVVSLLTLVGLLAAAALYAPWWQAGALLLLTVGGALALLDRFPALAPWRRLAVSGDAFDEMTWTYALIDVSLAPLLSTYFLPAFSLGLLLVVFCTLAPSGVGVAAVLLALGCAFFFPLLVVHEVDRLCARWLPFNPLGFITSHRTTR